MMGLETIIFNSAELGGMELNLF